MIIASGGMSRTLMPLERFCSGMNLGRTDLLFQQRLKFQNVALSIFQAENSGLNKLLRGTVFPRLESRNLAFMRWYSHRDETKVSC